MLVQKGILVFLLSRLILFTEGTGQQIIDDNDGIMSQGAGDYQEMSGNKMRQSSGKFGDEQEISDGLMRQGRGQEIGRTGMRQGTKKGLSQEILENGSMIQGYDSQNMFGSGSMFHKGEFDSMIQENEGSQKISENSMIQKGRNVPKQEISEAGSMIQGGDFSNQEMDSSSMKQNGGQSKQEISGSGSMFQEGKYSTQEMGQNFMKQGGYKGSNQEMSGESMLQGVESPAQEINDGFMRQKTKTGTSKDMFGSGSMFQEGEFASQEMNDGSMKQKGKSSDQRMSESGSMLQRSELGNQEITDSSMKQNFSRKRRSYGIQLLGRDTSGYNNAPDTSNTIGFNNAGRDNVNLQTTKRRSNSINTIGFNNAGRENVNLQTTKRSSNPINTIGFNNAGRDNVNLQTHRRSMRQKGKGVLQEMSEGSMKQGDGSMEQEMSEGSMFHETSNDANKLEMEDSKDKSEEARGNQKGQNLHITKQTKSKSINISGFNNAGKDNVNLQMSGRSLRQKRKGVSQEMSDGAMKQGAGSMTQKINAGSMVQDFDELEKGDCSKKLIAQRKKFLAAINVVIAKKIKILEQLEAKRILLSKKLRKLCALYKSRKDSPIVNKISITNNEKNDLMISIDGNKSWEKERPGETMTLIQKPDREVESSIPSPEGGEMSMTNGKQIISDKNEPTLNENAAQPLMQITDTNKMEMNVPKMENTILNSLGTDKMELNPEKMKIGLENPDLNVPEEMKMELTGMSVPRMPKQELEKVLSQSIKFANCPFGTVYSAKKKRCVSLISKGGKIIPDSDPMPVHNMQELLEKLKDRINEERDRFDEYTEKLLAKATTELYQKYETTEKYTDSLGSQQVMSPEGMFQGKKPGEFNQVLSPEGMFQGEKPGEFNQVMSPGTMEQTTGGVSKPKEKVQIIRPGFEELRQTIKPGGIIQSFTKPKKNKSSKKKIKKPVKPSMVIDNEGGSQIMAPGKMIQTGNEELTPIGEYKEMIQTMKPRGLIKMNKPKGEMTLTIPKHPEGSSNLSPGVGLANIQITTEKLNEYGSRRNPDRSDTFMEMGPASQIMGSKPAVESVSGMQMNPLSQIMGSGLFKQPDGNAKPCKHSKEEIQMIIDGLREYLRGPSDMKINSNSGSMSQSGNSMEISSKSDSMTQGSSKMNLKTGVKYRNMEINGDEMDMSSNLSSMLQGAGEMQIKGKSSSMTQNGDEMVQETKSTVSKIVETTTKPLAGAVSMEQSGAAMNMKMNNLFDKLKKDANMKFKKSNEKVNMEMKENADNFAMQMQNDAEKTENKVKKELQMKGRQLTLKTATGGTLLENSDEGLSIAKIHPEIEMPEGQETVKLTPIPVKGSQESMKSLMENLLKMYKNGNVDEKNLEMIMKQYPQFKGTTEAVLKKIAPKVSIVDEGDVAYMRQEGGHLQVNGKKTTLSALSQLQSNDEANAIRTTTEKEPTSPSKLVLRATLSNGKTIKVGEKNLTDTESMIKNNGSLTLSSLGIDLKNLNISTLNPEKPENSTKKPTSIEIVTKKIKPALFKPNTMSDKLSRRMAESKTTESATTTEKPATTLSVEVTSAPPEVQTTTESAPSTPTRLISNIFKKSTEKIKGVTEKIIGATEKVEDVIKKKKDRLGGLFTLSDEKGGKEIPATSREDIEKILNMPPPLMEFKSVVGKTMDSVGVPKLLDETKV